MRNNEIEFVLEDNYEGDRGWRIDLIEAVVDGAVVGKIKIAYIPSTEWVLRYSSVFNFAAVQGRHFHVGDRDGINWKTLTLTEDTLRYLWRSAFYSINGNWPEYCGATEPETNLRAEIEKLERVLARKLKKEIAEFKKFHVDKPMVDSIRVHESMRRQGIGSALYLQAARWMAERGLRLYASGLQSDEAKGVWKALENQGFVDKDRRGRFIRIVGVESNKTQVGSSYQ